ncbi:MAG: OprD family outer membrane porin [Sulfuricurvum sp.]|nr:OprD family outer membrane porin [Sulfuricurvum sp.]
MKLVKMSLATAVLLGASAFAIDNVKVSGDAQLFYGTNSAGAATTASGIEPAVGGNGGDLFSKGNSAADTAVRLGVTGDLLKGVSFGVTGYAVSTLGLENNLVSNVWSGAHGATANNSSAGAQVDDASWIGEAWLAATAGKTTVKAGRMALDTPLAYSETWSITPNTFEGAVLINQDIPDTTVVGAWIGNGNGVNTIGYANLSVGVDGIVGSGGDFQTFLSDGAYAAAVINNSLKPLVVQAWYYNVSNIANAYWLQADWDCQLIKDVKIGVQYADMDTKGLLDTFNDSSAYAVKLGYEGIKDLKLYAAYSDVTKDGLLKVANVATGNLSIAQSKLYTEGYMNYGYVGSEGAETYAAGATYNAGVATLGAQYMNSNGTLNSSFDTIGEHDVTEVTLTATKSFGPLDTTVAYYSTDADDQNDGKRYDSILAMLKLNF